VLMDVFVEPEFYKIIFDKIMGRERKADSL
jgi:hypothetical protein